MAAKRTSYLIKADNIFLTRQGNVILHDVTLKIRPHDFVTIIGPNGAGKTMLLKALLGFFPVEKGRIEYRPRLKIGYVPQRFIADATIPITARRFLALRRPVGNAAMQHVAKETGVGNILDCQLSMLSGGELQRVLLARALLNNPDVLVLDEPAQNLDVSGQLMFYKLLEKLHKNRRMSILMVSHDLHLVMASTRQVICLYHHVCCSGEPQAVAKDPEFIALFGNDMARMMAVYHHEHHHEHSRD